MYFHVYLIYRFTRTFTDHSSVITRCWGFELQNGKSSLKSQQTLAAQDFAPASFLSTPDNKKRTSKRMSSFYWCLFDLLCKSPACSGSYWKAGETGDTPPVAEEVSLFRGSGAVCGIQKATNSNAATVFTRPRFPLQIFLSLRAAEDFISFLGHIRQSK